jgi:sugar O-acyltransferase (sialic acid O-acetyltransferase NeuD family)
MNTDAAPVLLVGAGRFVREVIHLVRESGRAIEGIVDDRAETRGTVIAGVPVIGPLARAVDRAETVLVVAVAASASRRAAVTKLRAAGIGPERYASVVDATVRNPGDSPVGVGAILFPGVVITADANLGDHVVAMPGVTITHDCRIGDYVTFAAGVSLGGGVVVGEAAYLGMNASVRQEVTIGADATIGMGAAVLSDVPSGQTWAGVPAVRLGGVE